MIYKYGSAFDVIANGGGFYGKLDCEFFYRLIHEFFLSKGCFACGRKRYAPSARDIVCDANSDIILLRRIAICSPLANVVESTQI